MLKLSLICFLITIFAPFNPSRSQQISYSPDAILEKSGSNIMPPQIMGSKIHVWQWHPRKKMVLWQFDSSLRNVSSSAFNIPVQNAGQVSFLKFTNFYYLYCSYGELAQKKFELFKVGENGKTENVTDRFRGILSDSGFLLEKFSMLTLGQKLYFLSPLAVPVERKGIIVIRTADSLLNKGGETRVAFDLDVNTEMIQQIMLANDSTLYVLKARKQGRYTDELTLFQINIHTKKVTSLSYDSDQFLIFNPAIHEGRNGLWLRSLTLHETGNEKSPYIVKIYMARLNDSLTETVPGKIINVNASLKAETGKAHTPNYRPVITQPSAYYGFIVLSADMETSTTSQARTIVSYRDQTVYQPIHQSDNPSLVGVKNVQTTFFFPQTDIRQAGPGQFHSNTIHSMRLTWINDSINTQQDTVVFNDKPKTNILFQSGLILEEEDRLKILFPVKIKRSKNGIICYTVDKNKGISDQLMITDPDIEHFLNKSIPVGNKTYIFPFRNKNRIGLAKVRF